MSERQRGRDTETQRHREREIDRKKERERDIVRQKVSYIFCSVCLFFYSVGLSYLSYYICILFSIYLCEDIYFRMASPLEKRV